MPAPVDPIATPTVSAPVPEPQTPSTLPRPDRQTLPGPLPTSSQSGSVRFLLSVALVMAAIIAAAYVANHLISEWALRHHLRSAQVNLSAAMGGLFAGGLAALITILIVTNVNRGSKRQGG